MNDAELADTDLDRLFAQARAQTDTDRESAERFLTWHRAHLTAAQEPLHRAYRPLWPLLVAAALGAGLLARPLWPGGQLPASAAYDAYQSTWGEGW